MLLSSRKKNQNDAYRNKGTRTQPGPNANRHRKKKLFFKCIGEDRSHREDHALLRKWNEALSSLSVKRHRRIFLTSKEKRSMARINSKDEGVLSDRQGGNLVGPVHGEPEVWMEDGG